MFSRIILLTVSTLFILTATSQQYKNTNNAQFLRKWYVAGPIKSDTSSSPTEAAQQMIFNSQNLNVSYTDKSTMKPDLSKWKLISSNTDIIDLDSIFNHADFASAYAYAEIESDAAKNVLLGVGSDDALKVFHNGKLIHKNWIARGITADDDIIDIPLVKGKNEIILEVQDMQGGWGFTAHFLDQKSIDKNLIKASAAGNIEDVNRMLAAGANVNQKGENNQTAYDAARINGREDVITLLKAKGAKQTEVASPTILVDGLYQQLNKEAAPGIAILISQDGKIVYEKGFGYADVKNKVKITPQTKFRIGSITKQFIAAAILKLQEEGKITTTDKLSKFFPDFPRGDEVTIHHLLTHTSGIHSFTNKATFLDDVVKPVNNEQLYNYFKNDPYDFDPGARWMYNNSGYFLLGYIIEKITGDKYGAYLKKSIFDPLGMTNTGVHTPSIKLTSEALGYQKQTAGYDRALDWNMDWAGGAGSLYSTVEDLLKWNEALYTNKVVKAENLKAATTPVLLNNGQEPPGIKYGYGLGMGEYRGVKTVSHSGGLHGFISQLLRIPEKNMNVVMLTNVMPPQVEIDPVKVAELYLWKDMPKQASFARSANEETDIEKYTGRYDFSNGTVMTISKEANGLYAQLSGQPKFQIFQSAPGHYFWKVVEATIHFKTDSAGNVTHGYFEQGGFKVNAPKMADIKYATVDPKVLQQFVGTYKFKENTNIEVTVENNNLFAKATGDPKFQLYPFSETEYHIKELNATLTFKKDAAGKVSSVNVKFAGDNVDAPKIR